MRNFWSGYLPGQDLLHADEKHCITYLQNFNTLAERGESKVKNADTVGGNKGLAFMVRLGGGCNAEMGVSMIIYQN